MQLEFIVLIVVIIILVLIIIIFYKCDIFHKLLTPKIKSKEIVEGDGESNIWIDEKGINSDGFIYTTHPNVLVLKNIVKMPYCNQTITKSLLETWNKSFPAFSTFNTCIVDISNKLSKISNQFQEGNIQDNKLYNVTYNVFKAPIYFYQITSSAYYTEQLLRELDRIHMQLYIQKDSSVTDDVLFNILLPNYDTVLSTPKYHNDLLNYAFYDFRNKEIDIRNQLNNYIIFLKWMIYFSRQCEVNYVHDIYKEIVKICDFTMLSYVLYMWRILTYNINNEIINLIDNNNINGNFLDKKNILNRRVKSSMNQYMNYKITENIKTETPVKLLYIIPLCTTNNIGGQHILKSADDALQIILTMKEYHNKNGIALLTNDNMYDIMFMMCGYCVFVLEYWMDDQNKLMKYVSQFIFRPEFFNCTEFLLLNALQSKNKINSVWDSNNIKFHKEIMEEMLSLLPDPVDNSNNDKLPTNQSERYVKKIWVQKK